MTWEHLRQLREMMRKAAVSLPDEDALQAVELFPAWAVGVEYAEDTAEHRVRIRYGGKLYRVVQAHTSQADWTPDITPALYTEVAEPGTIPVWRQPTGAQDAYRTGDRVRYPDEEGDVWVSTTDDNVWEPGVYGWEKEE
jgi:hypothetical protein